MANLIQRNIYEYCLKDWKEVESALTNLVRAEKDLIQKQVPIIEKLFRYIYPLYDVVTAGANNPFWSTQSGMLKFLDTELLKKFLADPLDKSLRDKLSEQLMLLCVALGNQTDIVPYDQEDLKEIVAGKSSSYNDMVFVHTLALLLIKTVDKEKIDVLCGLLKAEGGQELQIPIEWPPTFILSLVLQVLWRNIEILDWPQKDLLIKNYLHLSLVAGVPVREIVEKYVNTGTSLENKEKVDLFFNDLLNSQEDMPLDNRCEEWRNVSDVIKNYMAQLDGGAASGFTQEQFISGFYQNQIGKEVLRSWLRELVILVSRVNASSVGV